MTRTTPLINVMERAARRAARSLVRDFGEIEQLQASRRGPQGFASQACKRATSMLSEDLRRSRPDFGFHRGGPDVIGPDGETRWIISPVDGLLNFLHAIPHFAITIAVERDSELVCGLTYEPIRGELFWAEQGEGAYLNRHRLRVSERSRLSEAMLATVAATGGKTSNESHAMRVAAMNQTAGVRQQGAASLDLAYVAAGRFDGFWHPASSLPAVAAGLVIVREAGGMVDCLDGNRTLPDEGILIATNQHLHDGVRRMLQKIRGRSMNGPDRGNRENG